jgi:hypothetical protein
MMTRRSFLTRTATAAAATAFARAADGQRARRQVMVGGRRVIVVDGHAHCVVPEVAGVVKGTPLADVFRTSASQTGSNDVLLLGPDRLRQMDVEVLNQSVVAWRCARSRAIGDRAQNEGLAAACAPTAPIRAAGDRRAQQPDLPRRPEHAVVKLGMRGGRCRQRQRRRGSRRRSSTFWSKCGSTR